MQSSIATENALNDSFFIIHIYMHIQMLENSTNICMSICHPVISLIQNQYSLPLN